jgi:hypothetical protein
MATSALEKFVLLAKGAKGASCRTIIEEVLKLYFILKVQVLSSPDIFVFGELLELSSVQEATPQ